MGCPLCGGTMTQTGGYMTCQSDTNHSMHIIKEWERYKSGDKSIEWLKARMKIRMGKAVHGR